MFAEFLSQYGLQLLYTAILGVAGYLGLVLKNLCTRYLSDKTKKAVAKTTVQYVEQVYKDLHGEEKLQAALSAASEMLMEKGIAVSDLELRALIEAALAELSGVFQEAVTE